MAFHRLEAGASGSLYAVEPATAPVWSGYYLPNAAAPEGKPPESIEPVSAWGSYWGNPREGVNGGCYLFLGKPPPAGTAEALATLLKTLNGREKGWAYRYLLWIGDPAAQPLQPDAAVAFAPEGKAGALVKEASIAFRTLFLKGQKGLTVDFSPEAEALTLTPQSSTAGMSLSQTRGAPTEIGKVTGPAKLPVAGGAAGQISLPLTMTVRAGGIEDDFGRLVTGVKYFYDAGAITKSQLFRLLGVPKGSSKVPFQVALDPLRPTDEERTCFTFAANEAGAFTSPLRTVTGTALALTPVPGASGLALAPDRVTEPQGKQIDSYYATLKGAFTIGGPPEPVRLLCGLSGLENVVVNPAREGYGGDRLVFHPGHAAHAPVFPPRAAELDEASRKALEQELLDTKAGTLTTAWASLEGTEAQPSPSEYFAQPQGAPLFSAGTTDKAGLLDLLDEPVGPADVPFPLAAYFGAEVTKGQDGFEPKLLPLYEQAAISPTRRLSIQPRSLPAPAEADGVEVGKRYGAATPQGFLVDLAQGAWTSLMIADTDPASEKEGELGFSPVAPSLQGALQTDQLFLVATKTIEGFKGRIGIEEWPFDVTLGQNQAFGSYSNVLIFKFCDGALQDLVSDPRRWTGAGTFNETANGGLLALSQWLQSYLKESKASKEPALAHFNSLAADPKWQGVLALRVDVPLDQLPPQVSALRCGIDSPKLSAHHLGVEINQLTPDGTELQGPSSLFGLIDYTDPVYGEMLKRGASSETPVPPAPGLTYDFKTLRLLVLFENSEVKQFTSSCQVTLTQWFGDPVVPPAGGGPPQTSLVLQGALQHHDGQSVYTFSSRKGGVFPLDSKVLPSVTVATASLETISAATDGGVGTYRFPFGGALELAELPGSADLPGVDLLSFEGLAFQDLALEMNYDPSAAVPRTFRFATERTSLDAGVSAPREGGMFRALPLTLRGFVAGEAAPTSLGFANVKLSGTPVSPLGQQWYGFSLDFDLGTPGALAAEAGWTATLLVAWGAGSKRTDARPPRAAAGMRLPGSTDGSKTLSLQGVLGLSVEDIQLARAKGRPSPYMMRLTNLALSLLGLKFPPGYGTAFYLFGNPATPTERSSLGWYAALVKK